MEEKGHLDELNERYTDLQKEYNNMLEEKRIAEEQKKVRINIFFILNKHSKQ